MASPEETICFICSKNLQDEDTVTVTRGMNTLREASKKYCDGKLNYMEGRDSVTVHKNCRNWYTKSWNVEAAVRRRKVTEDSKVGFNVHLK